MVLLAAAALAVPTAALAAGESSPADVTTAIYAIYAGPKGDYQTGNLDDKRVADYLSKSLRAALKAMDARSKKLNEPILDFDPVTDSQDPQVEKLSIAPEGDARRSRPSIAATSSMSSATASCARATRGRSTTSQAAPATTSGTCATSSSRGRSDGALSDAPCVAPAKAGAQRWSRVRRLED